MQREKQPSLLTKKMRTHFFNEEERAKTKCSVEIHRHDPEEIEVEFQEFRRKAA